jgi:oligopeptide/dipeptide ABC transporter ATP-binding protein
VGELLSATAVSVRYGEDLALSGVDLEVAPGTTIGIVGESGSGKSTLARVLAGAIAPTSGTMLVEGESWSAISRRDPRRQRVQMVFQDPYASLNPLQSAVDAVAEVHQVWDGLSRGEARRRAAEGLERVGLASALHAETPKRLSGGQCQRVGIARALACGPDVLIADEPTSALDVSVQAQILGLLQSLQRERSLAVVLVSHDLNVVRCLTAMTLVMYAGKVVESGPTSQLLREPRHPYTDLLLASSRGSGPELPGASEIGAVGACVFSGRCPRAAERCLQEPPELRGDGHLSRCHFPLSEPAGDPQQASGARA